MRGESGGGREPGRQLQEDRPGQVQGPAGPGRGGRAGRARRLCSGSCQWKKQLPSQGKAGDPFHPCPHSMSASSPREIAFLLVFLSCLINASALCLWSILTLLKHRNLLQKHRKPAAYNLSPLSGACLPSPSLVLSICTGLQVKAGHVCPLHN